MSKITYNPNRHLAQELGILIQIFDNRKSTGDPLMASELLVQVPREKYEQICRLAYENLIQKLSVGEF